MAMSFTWCRREPELVTPARPTPHEYKVLSDIDDQRWLRGYYPAAVEFFRCRPDAGLLPMAHGVVDPVGIITSALAEALVSYYPLAGRLVELPAVAAGKLLVDCTAEGIVFVEADADVRLEDLGQALAPPYPCVEELLCYDNVGEPKRLFPANRCCFSRSQGSPTTMVSPSGTATATTLWMASAWRSCWRMYRLARGEMLTTLPVWGRELITARVPQLSVTYKHSAYEQLPASTSTADIIWKTPLESLKEMGAIRSRVPARLLQCTTTFELVAATVWRCRTAALEYPPNQQVRVIICSNARGTWKPRSPLPKGFYGNALILLTAEANVDELCGGPLSRAIELVRSAKIDVTDEYVQSMLDSLVQRQRPFYSLGWMYFIADTSGLSRRKANIDRWDHVGGGITAAGKVVATSLQSYYDRRKSSEDFVTVSMCLPPAAMERFADRITAWLNDSVVMSSL